MIQPPRDTFTTNLGVCYEILLYVSSRMARLSPGDVFEFVAGDPGAAEKIPEWCEARNFTLVSTETLSGGGTRFLIRK